MKWIKIATLGAVLLATACVGYEERRYYNEYYDHSPSGYYRPVPGIVWPAPIVIPVYRPRPPPRVYYYHPPPLRPDRMRRRRYG
jgi:hypothetical protein